MKHSYNTLLITLMLIATIAAFSAPVIAHGQRDNDRAAERITMTWLIDGDSGTYEITAPDHLRLWKVKLRFIATSGLSIRDARNYVVEKVVNTSSQLPSRGPGQTQGTLTPRPVTSVTEYIPMEDRLRLSEQDIRDGDTLRIRMAQQTEEATTTGYRHKGHRQGRFHHIRHGHHRGHRD